MSRDSHILLRKAALWSAAVRDPKIVVVSSPDEISDENIRFNILRQDALSVEDSYHNKARNNYKTWFDTSARSLFVYLPHFRDEIELDSILLERVTEISGLKGILGPGGADKVGLDVFNNLYPDLQEKLLIESLSGHTDDKKAQAYAGRQYLASAVKKVIDSPDEKKAFSHWRFLFMKHIQECNAVLWSSLVLDTNRKASIMAAGLRGYIFQNVEKRNVRLYSANSNHVIDKLLKLNAQELRDDYIDRGDHITLGMPSDVFLSGSTNPRSVPIELPVASIFADVDGTVSRRYEKPSKGTKKDRHPFSLTNLTHIKDELDYPLATFKSRSSERSRSTLYMLHTKEDRDGESQNFCVVSTPTAVKNDLQEGRIPSRFSGQWVNRIDSVYPRNDLSYIFFLSNKGLVNYLEPGFYESWFLPAVERLDAAYEALFHQAEIPIPSKRELKKILAEMPAFSTENFRQDKNVDRSLTEGLDQSGLLREYAAYKAAVESATKVIKEFENPKIIQRNIEFSVLHKKENVNIEAYKLATDVTMFFANNLNRIGIQTIVVSNDEARNVFEIERTKTALRHQQELFKSNGTIYGYQLGDTIYLTPLGVNPNSPIHEYAHIWAKVYEKQHPVEWEALKEELKTLPYWTEIAESKHYSHISIDENRLAGEVLAMAVGNKGEELQLRAANETLEGVSHEKATPTETTKSSAERFIKIVTDMAIKDVFDAEGMSRTGEVTLKVLKDFAEGNAIELGKQKDEKLAAMADTNSKTKVGERSRPWIEAVYAPNGKLSNLSKEDYVYIHSESFKRIAGDWESARLIKQARNAWVNETSKDRTNFIPSEAFISEVKRLTGLDTRLVVILDDTIRHIRNHHGTKEEQRGQTDMSPEDIATIPYIINNFDSIVRSPDYDNSNGGFALTITKRINGFSYVGIINKGKRNEIVVSAWNRKTSAALDVSTKDTPGLYVRNDTDLIAKVKNDIELIKHSAENVLIPLDENGEPTTEAVKIIRHIDELDLIAAQEENKGLFDQGYENIAAKKVAQIEKEIANLKQQLVILSNSQNAIQTEFDIDNITDSNKTPHNPLTGLLDSPATNVLERVYATFILKNTQIIGLDEVEEALNKASLKLIDTNHTAKNQTNRAFQEGRLQNGDTVVVKDPTSGKLRFNIFYSSEPKGLFPSETHPYTVKLNKQHKVNSITTEDLYGNIITQHYSGPSLSAVEIRRTSTETEWITPATTFRASAEATIDASRAMNSYELTGAIAVLNTMREPLEKWVRQFRESMPELISSSRVEEELKKADELMKTITALREESHEEIKTFAQRGYRTSNNLWERITGKVFTPSFMLPPKDVIEEFEACLKNNGEYEFREMCKEAYRKSDITYIEDMLPNDSLSAKPEAISTRAITMDDLVDLGYVSRSFEEQIRLSGRYDGNVKIKDGSTWVIVQKHDDKLIAMKETDATQLIEHLTPRGFVRIGDSEYKVNKTLKLILSSGCGAYVTNKENPEDKQYVVLDIVSKTLVPSTPFEKIYAEESRKVASTAVDQYMKTLEESKNERQKNAHSGPGNH